MKNNIYFLALILILSSACNKDDDSSSSSGFITAKIDGQNLSHVHTNAKIIDLSIIQVFAIAGAKVETDDVSERIVIVFDFPSSESLAETTYTSQGTTCNGNDEICGFLVYGEGGVDDDLEYTADNNGATTISISSLDYKSGGHVAGTFSGTLYNDDGDELMITDGEFNVGIE